MITITKGLDCGRQSLTGARHVDQPHVRLVVPSEPRLDLPDGTMDEAMRTMLRSKLFGGPYLSSHHVGEHEV
jgi:hypothetical protein